MDSPVTSVPTSVGQYKVQDHAVPTHPLDVINADEIKIATDLTKEFFKYEPSIRFCRVYLQVQFYGLRYLDFTFSPIHLFVILLFK